MFGAFWKSRRAFQGMNLLWKAAWKSNIETLAVFLYGSRVTNIIFKVEYVHESPTCRIEITCMFTGWGMQAPRELASIESLAKKLLTELFSFGQDELYPFAVESGLDPLPAEQGVVEIFLCPYCGARYLKRGLQCDSDGSVRCQNCGRWVPPFQPGPEAQKAE